MKVNGGNLMVSSTRLLYGVLLIVSLGSSSAAQIASERTQSVERPQPPVLERAKYQITLKLNFDLRTYEGFERVRWANRGDRSTSALYFHLYSNLRVAQSTPATTANSAALALAEADEPRTEITEVRSVVDNERLTFALDDQGTILRINLREAVAPGESAEVLIGFKGSVPEIDPEETGIATHVIKQVSAALRNERETRRARDINFRCRGLMLLATFHPVLAVHDGEEWQRKIEPSVGVKIFNEVAD
jgi:hypothetical protein